MSTALPPKNFTFKVATIFGVIIRCPCEGSSCNTRFVVVVAGDRWETAEFGGLALMQEHASNINLAGRERLTESHVESVLPLCQMNDPSQQRIRKRFLAEHVARGYRSLHATT